jgi:hypothetical protein
MSGTTTHQMRINLEYVRMSPALADTLWGQRWQLLTFSNIPIMRDATVPVDEVWLVCKTETGGIATIVYNLND